MKVKPMIKKYWKFMWTVAWFSIILLTSHAGYAVQYYVDDTNGNDVNSGTSPATAWQSLAKVSEQVFNPGDSILLKRSETWEEQLVISESTEGPILFGAYGSGADPVIRGITARGDDRTFENLVVDVNQKARLLFSTGLEFQTDLDNGVISEGLRQVFEANAIPLSQKATVSIKEMGLEWLINDKGYKQTYPVRGENDQLNILTSDAVRLHGAKHCVFRQMTVRNGTGDGIDVIDADGLLIESSLVHHFLAGSFVNQVDAHAIFATDTQGLIIRNTEAHHVSGDLFQTDPDRDTDTPDEILIENCHFWTGPLEQDFNESWFAGETPGENAIDTKMVKREWESVPRMRITVRNMLSHGFIKDGFINNRAVFNMKEKIEAVFDGVTIYDCEIGFRLRGTRGNANVTIMNGVISDCDKAIRAEDDLSNLKVYNSTFGDALGLHIDFAGGSGGFESWDIRNNAIVNSDLVIIDSDPMPIDISHIAEAIMADANHNKVTTDEDFVDNGSRDYHLADASGLIDAGTGITAVVTDRDGVERPQGAGYDVGAYEHLGQNGSGFWKNHLTAWLPTGYAPDQQVDSVFTVPTELSALADDSLLDALNYGGGPGIMGGGKILLRAAIAALLNAAHPAVNCPRTVDEVISDVNAALASLDRATMLELAEELD